MDFESGTMPALLAQLPGVILRGCLFHHCQAIYRKMQNLGLIGLYLDPDDPSFRIVVRKMMALAFLPELRMQGAFNQLIATAPQHIAAAIQPLFLYYDRKWLNNANMANVVLMYNMYGVQRRTNNNIEGWHNGMALKLGTHPNIFKFITKLKEEEAATVVIQQQIFVGLPVTPKRRKEYARVNALITTVTGEYNNGLKNDDEYITALAHILAEPTNLSL
jgi:hypothetical protein